MIKKIISIRNIGRYTAFNAGANWDGLLKKANIIYGENGVGKTTLSIVLRSLSGDDAILEKKQSFFEGQPPEVSILDDKNNPINYKNRAWNKHLSNIRIFDAHFIEDNLYTGSSHTTESKTNLFNIIVGEDGVRLSKIINELKIEKKRLRSINNEIMRSTRYRYFSRHEKEDDELKVQVKENRKEIQEIVNKLKVFDSKLGEHSQLIFEQYINKINYFLEEFTPHIQIRKLSKTLDQLSQLVSYDLLVDDRQIKFDDSNKLYPSVKFTLSEGDKSAVAFSFFLAKLYSEDDISSRIVIFDDPISSFDSTRKRTTINQLRLLNERVEQLFIFTHDINFASLLSQELPNSPLNLKIIRKGRNSTIVKHNIEEETISGIFKDINTLRAYLINGAVNEYEKREVIRCVRPILEGILRIKYFSEISSNEWLGDILKKARDATSDSSLSNLKPLLDQISDINSYSKSFHHSNPTNQYGDIISDEELRLYVDKTLRLIQKI